MVFQFKLSSFKIRILPIDPEFNFVPITVSDTQQAKLLEERYKTTIEKSPPEFVKPLPAIQEIKPGETTR